ncbi:hypothetical protein BH09BAC5_BH09BAC5_08210 [soil metagenome]
MKPRFLFLVLTISFSISVSAQGPWTQKASMPGNARHRIFTFTIGSRGYMGCGWNGVTMYQDFWEYDPGTDTWLQKANYPAGPRLSAFGFAINGKGYAGCGLDQGLYVHNDFYEYNPVTNQWTAKAPWIGTPIFGGASAVVNNIGYVICGDDWDLGYYRHREMYAYHPTTNSWNYVTDFPADGRRDPCALAINNKIYVGTGSDNNYFECNDWWEYNPANNQWTAKANFGGSARSQAVGFAVAGKGYLGTGGQADVQDFFQYDATTNTWLEVNEFPGQGRENSSVFVMGNKAYLVCGTSGTNYRDLWEFDPLHIVGLNQIEQISISGNVFPNPAYNVVCLELIGTNIESKKEFSLFTIEGKCISSEKFLGNKLNFSVNGFAAGTYLYEVKLKNDQILRGKFIVL